MSSINKSPVALAGAHRASQSFRLSVEHLKHSQSRDNRQGAVDPDQTYSDIYETADDMRSYAVSIREAAFRQDSIWLRIHRVEFVRQAKLLVGLIRDIAPLEDERGAK
jgi:hypothetical protein